MKKLLFLFILTPFLCVSQAWENVNNFINLGGTFDEAVIYNIFGKRIISSTKTQIDISQLSNGIYFIRTRVNDRHVIREFVITEK